MGTGGNFRPKTTPWGKVSHSGGKIHTLGKSAKHFLVAIARAVFAAITVGKISAAVKLFHKTVAEHQSTQYFILLHHRTLMKPNGRKITEFILQRAHQPISEIHEQLLSKFSHYFFTLGCSNFFNSFFDSLLAAIFSNSALTVGCSLDVSLSEKICSEVSSAANPDV